MRRSTVRVRPQAPVLPDQSADRLVGSAFCQLFAEAVSGNDFHCCCELPLLPRLPRSGATRSNPIAAGRALEWPDRSRFESSSAHSWALGKEDRSPRPVKSAHRRTRMGGPGGGWSRCGWGSDTRSRRGPALEPVVWTARLGGISHSDRKGGEALPQADGSRPLSKTTHCRLSNNSRAASK